MLKSIYLNSWLVLSCIIYDIFRDIFKFTESSQAQKYDENKTTKMFHNASKKKGKKLVIKLLLSTMRNVYYLNKVFDT